MSNIKEYIKNNNWGKAFSTARKFFFGLTKDELKEIEIAADYLNGHGSFYKSVGIDCIKSVEAAKNILITKYA